jgi:hypothetical protein
MNRQNKAVAEGLFKVRVVVTLTIMMTAVSLLCVGFAATRTRQAAAAGGGPVTALRRDVGPFETQALVGSGHPGTASNFGGDDITANHSHDAIERRQRRRLALVRS